VLTFEFGLNWAPFARDVGPIIGVIIAMEVLTAFLVEASFAGLFGSRDSNNGPVAHS
jgi:cytochrome bd ubiquinol oxidase subunit I